MKTEREDSDSVQSGEACPFGTKTCALYISFSYQTCLSGK